MKGLAKELFNKINSNHNLFFVFLNSFKEDYKKKQYTNFMKKTLEEINLLHSDEKFDNEKFKLILQILFETLKKEKSLIQ